MEEKQRKNLYHAYIIKAQDSSTWEKDVEMLSKEDRKPIPQIFEEFVTRWNVDGASRIYEAKSYVRKSIWIILWLSCFSYGSYQCYNTFQEYQKFEKSVTIDVTDVDSIEFPAVTFCTLSPLSPDSIDWYKSRPNWNAFLDLQECHGGECSDEQVLSCSAKKSVVDSTGNGSLADPTDSTGNETVQGRRKRFLFEKMDIFEILESSIQIAPESKRVRRSLAILTAPTNFLNLPDDQISNTRINCSKKYQRFLFQFNEDIGKDQPSTLQLGKTNYCQDLAKYEQGEKLYYDPLCTGPVVMDAYGFYSLEAAACNPVRKVQNGSQDLICSDCCHDYGTEENCLNVSDYNTFSDSDVVNSMQGLEKIVKFSRTTDGIDVSSKFTVTPEDIDSSSTSSTNVIRTCSFDSSSCSSRDFQQWNSYKYGRCYTFNGNFIFNNSKIASVKNNTRNTRAFGPKNGLRLTIDINSKEILSLLSPEIGLRVLFHKSDTMPFPEDEGINVTPGVSTSIQISMQQIERQKAPWGKCEDTDLQTQYNYTQLACQKICLEKNYRQKCNCYVGMGPAFAHLPMPDNNEQCSLFNITQYLCTDEILFSYYQGDLNCTCPLSCSEWSYDTTVTSSDTDLKYYRIIQQIKKETIGDDVCTGDKNATVRLQVFLNALSFTKITENKAYSFETLVANIGGSVGLFVGASVISCLEVIEFLVNVLLHYIWKRKGQSGKPDARAPIFILHEQTGDQDLAYLKHDQRDMILTSYFTTNQMSKDEDLSNQNNIGKKEKAKNALEKMFLQ